MTTTLDESAGGAAPPSKGPKPVTVGERKTLAQVGVYIFILVPFAALIAAVLVIYLI